ncbi:GGDEF domain-containing protein [Piscinibacter sp.]|uniref:GGDEF domain-containing protein n=1 Tax=Piscinibacter sp. TaxID=1903157 RepID=UPI0039E5FACF
MAELVEHLAELTGFRDRERLDVTLVGALRDLLRPRSVAIYRSVGEPGQERWLTRARLAEGDLAASADPAWIELDGLPRHAEHPQRLQAFQGQAIVVAAGPPHRAWFPVASDHEPPGVLEIESDAPLEERDQRLVLSILRIYRNFQGLLDYGERDTLTGLLNRKTFDDNFLKSNAGSLALAGPQAPGERREHPRRCRHWLGVIDIDHFKRVNDEHGHLIGDEVLLLMSRLMRSSFRLDDRLYRFGGEEFVVLMRCTAGDAAALAFERLRQNVERHVFPQVGGITVSIGFTELKPDDSPSSAFERADRAVYFAKGHGRNQVRYHADLVAAGHLSDGARAGDVELF